MTEQTNPVENAEAQFQERLQRVLAMKLTSSEILVAKAFYFWGISDGMATASKQFISLTNFVDTRHPEA